MLPVVGAFTVALLAGGAKIAADHRFVHSKSALSACIREEGPLLGLRGVPNSDCLEKTPESGLVEYRFNACGDRTALACAPGHDGSFRIALIGSSFAMGLRVPAEDSFAERLGPELSRRAGRRVEVYNAAMYGTGGTPRSLAHRIHRIVALDPDLILWVMGSWEIDPTEGPVVQFAARGSSSKWDGFLRALDQSRAAGYLRHLLYTSQSLYLDAYLRGSPEAVMLAARPSERVRERLRLFDADAAAILSGANAAGVPVAATFLPNRAESALISKGAWPVDIDPYRLDRELGAAVSSRGAIFVDILPRFRTIANPERFYFPLDTHLDARGHAMVTGMLADALSEGDARALQALRPRAGSNPPHAKGF